MYIELIGLITLTMAVVVSVMLLLTQLEARHRERWWSDMRRRGSQKFWASLTDEQLTTLFGHETVALNREEKKPNECRDLYIATHKELN